MIMNDNIFTGMVENLEDNFLEISSGVITSLRETDGEYAALCDRQDELQKRFPCIQAVLEGEGAVSMSAEEHKGLLEYLDVTGSMEDIKRLRLYYAGHRDCFAYLKKIGAV
jgi:hypothetical protein